MKGETKQNKGINIDSKELVIALNELEKEKGIKKDYMLESIETALVTAYKRNYDSNADNVKVTMHPESGEIHVIAEMEVVETVEDDKTQINLEDAKKVNKNLEVGDTAQVEIIPRNFGRIAAQTAKQVIIQKIREASRNVLFDEFSERKGEIISGLVQKADGGIVVVDLGKLEGVMPLKEQIPTEKYKVNDKIRACVMDVERGVKGAPQVIISRASSDFVRKLFELEIPEIYEGVIEIKSVSRDPGSRSKVAVYSDKENIEPVGCVIGANGSRINRVLKQIAKEKIDVVLYDKNPVEFIKNALSPAKDIEVFITDPKKKMATCIVNKDNLSLAIGKKGINIKLAARLTHYKLDVKCIDDVNIDEYREKYSDIKNIDETPEEEKGEVKDIEEVVETDEENSNA